MTIMMPNVDLSRFAAISPRTIVLTYLRSNKTAVTEKLLTRNLARIISAEQLQSTLDIARNERLVTSSMKLELSDVGRRAADQELGRDAGKPWSTISSRTLPLMALGLAPDAVPNITVEALRARAIAVGFGLADRKTTATKAGVCSALVWQTMRAAMPTMFGSGPFAPIERPGPVEKVILAKLADTRAKTADQIFAALSATAIQSNKSDAESFRRGLIQAGLRKGQARGKHVDKVSPDTDGGFAARVKAVAGGLSTPPFQGRVAISQVYDAYGQTHSDAGSLATFKARLVKAAQESSLELGRLDLPEQMDKDRRLRSESPWGDNVVHFVITVRE